MGNSFVALDVKSILSPKALEEYVRETGSSPKDAEMFLTGKRDSESSGMWIAIENQHIAAMSAIAFLSPKAPSGTDKPAKRTGVVTAIFTGTERDIVLAFCRFFKKTLEHINNGDWKGREYPVIVTSDGGGHAIRILANKCIELRSELKQSGEDIPVELDVFLKNVMDANDKWGKNYLNPNSTAICDLKSKFGFSATPIWGFKKTSELAASGDILELAKFTATCAAKNAGVYANIQETLGVNFPHEIHDVFNAEKLAERAFNNFHKPQPAPETTKTTPVPEPTR